MAPLPCLYLQYSARFRSDFLCLRFTKSTVLMIAQQSDGNEIVMVTFNVMLLISLTIREWESISIDAYYCSRVIIEKANNVH
jgi:hypothetical protein